MAKPKAHEDRRPLGRAMARARRVLIGRPLATAEEIGERLSKAKALAIFSSDAISSSAYATEEILRVLVLGGLAALTLSLPVSIGIALLLTMVAISYRQICIAYPNGGGSYSVAKANLGRMASLVAASALLIDYTLTVAVSISSASEQIASAFPELHAWKVLIGVVAIALVTLGNLRGLRESGNIFALPTYLFIGSALLMIGMGVFRIVVEGQPAVAPAIQDVGGTLEAVGLLLVLRAFASGSVALTGTEAIATGVPAFKPPEPRNAATTLVVMAGMLGILFVGITFLASHFGVLPNEEQTVVAQVAAQIYGAGSVAFYLFTAFTALLLFLAANTAFAAFPRLGAVLAEDGFFPRQFAYRGDRLAFTTGIVLLGVVAALLVVLFGADTHALIPLYAVGVFIDFTISQSGMVRHWLSTRERGWQYRLAINASGAILTGVVAVVVTTVKAPTSLVIILLIPAIAGLMLFIRREYDTVSRELAMRPEQIIGPPQRRERVVVPVPGLSRAVVQAVNFGRSLADDVRAVHVSADPEEAAALRENWERQLPGVPLVIVESPYRSLVLPFLSYLDVMMPAEPDLITLIVLPEYVPRHWWDRILYNQTTNRLRRALIGRPDTVVATVPYRREEEMAGDRPPPVDR
ncbi:MAG: APC family permease [Chloroflexi bacterium]|nr:APC family permease [Chloroflexota bacterium]